jgi:hypothetical protein
MSLSTARHAQIADSTKLTALSRRAGERSEYLQIASRFPPLSARCRHERNGFVDIFSICLELPSKPLTITDVHRKWSKDDDHNHTEHTTSSVSNANRKLASRDALDSIQNLNSAASRRSHEAEPRHDEHVPHSICAFLDNMYENNGSHALTVTDQSHGRLNSLNTFSDLRRLSINSQSNGMSMLAHALTPFGGDGQTSFFANMATPKLNVADLPLFIKPLPAKIGPDDVAYLEKKGALTLPKATLRSEMLRAFVEYVHPYMPLLDLHDFLMMIDQPDGSLGKVSLILFQAVMFAGAAFVDMQYLRAAGYVTRKEARKDFFQKTRVSEIYLGRGFASRSADFYFPAVVPDRRPFACDFSETPLTRVTAIIRLRLRVRPRFSGPSFASPDLLL